MILGGYPLDVMGKQQTTTHIAKNEMPASMGIIFFEAPTTTLCLVRCLATTPRPKQEKAKSNQDFMNPLKLTHIFSFVWTRPSAPHHCQCCKARIVCHGTSPAQNSGRKCSHHCLRPPLAVTKPSELAAAESHSQSHCSLQMGGGCYCMNIQKTVTKAWKSCTNSRIFQLT